MNRLVIIIISRLHDSAVDAMDSYVTYMVVASGSDDDGGMVGGPFWQEASSEVKRLQAEEWVKACVKASSGVQSGDAPCPSRWPSHYPRCLGGACSQRSNALSSAACATTESFVPRSMALKALLVQMSNISTGLAFTTR